MIYGSPWGMWDVTSWRVSFPAGDVGREEFHVVCHVSSTGHFSPTQICSRLSCNQLNPGWRTAENQLCSVHTAWCSQILAGGWCVVILSAESLRCSPTSLEQNTGVLAGSWQCKCGFWCSQAQLLLQQLPQEEKPFISPLFSFSLEDRRVKPLIFAFCFFTGASPNKDCPWDNGALIIFNSNVLNWVIFPQINYLCLRNRAVFFFQLLLLCFAVVSLHKANKQNLVSNPAYKMSFYYLSQVSTMGFNTVGAEK